MALKFRLKQEIIKAIQQEGVFMTEMALGMDIQTLTMRCALSIMPTTALRAHEQQLYQELPISYLGEFEHC